MATLILNSISSTQINFVPHNSISSPKSHNNVVMMARNLNNFTVTRCYPEPKAKHVEPKHRQDGIGIGIAPFLRGKELLITGATGLLAKVLVEKILREIPDVGKMYLIVKAPTVEAATLRLKSEVINNEVFKLLQETYGDSYDTFMLSKLVPVIGNICDSDLGLEKDIAYRIASKIDVIVNSAANTVFDQRYDVALRANTNGPTNVIRFAKGCKQLKLFLHVSSAYANGEREGKIMEKPFRMGDSIAREKYSQGLQYSQPEPPILDVEAELQFAFQNSSTRKMKELGKARAKSFGWQDTYSFTKAMGEMMIGAVKEDVRVVIVRPAAIESTLKEPYPGWIQGNRMVDPLIMNYGEGKLPGFLANPNTVFDIIPVDMVANAILAAMARHGSMDKSGDGINVYHVGSSVANPISFRDLFRMFSEHFSSYPYIDPITGSTVKVSPFEIFNSAEDFSASIWQTAVQQIADSSVATGSSPSEKNLSPQLEKLLKRSTASLQHLVDVYLPYTFYNGRFDISNSERLMECMSEEEKSKFNFDVRSINWEHYIKGVHIPGFRRHVMTKKKT